MRLDTDSDYMTCHSDRLPLTITAAAEESGISKWTIIEARKKGHIRSFRSGTTWLLRRESWEQWRAGYEARKAKREGDREGRGSDENAIVPKRPIG